MKVFRLYPIGEYEQAGPVDVEDFDQIEGLDGTPRSDSWTPIAFEIVTEDGDSGAPLSHADVPWLGSYALILRDKAIDVAGRVLTPFGELLPLTCESANLALFNPVQVVDALNEDASDIDRFRDGRLMSIEEYAFHADALTERMAFKIPQEPNGAILYTEAVVNDLKGLGLTGLDFTMLWDSGAG